jgi:hypothetical protein
MGRVARTPLAAVGLLTPAPRNAARTAQHADPDDIRAQIDPIDVPLLMIGEELSATPNGGCVRARPLSVGRVL